MLSWSIVEGIGTSPILFGTVSFILLTYVWYKLSQPLNRITRMEDVGFKASGKLSKKEVSVLSRKLRAIGDPPPPYPNGWYCLAESAQIAHGNVKHIAALGENLAVFRGTDGVVHILNAYCPHLGANLGVGGKVIKENCLKCPFHGWIFRGTDGKCVDIPYSSSGKTPESAKTKVWHSMEINNHIYVWYHADNIEPNWDLPVFQELNSKEFVYRGRTEGYLDVHVQDISENGADVAHLGVIHKPGIWAGTDLDKLNFEVKNRHHEWEAKWTQAPLPNTHVGIMKVKEKIEIFGITMPFSSVSVEIKQNGPAVVYQLFDLGIFGSGALTFHILPLDPRTTRIVQQFYSTWRFPAVLSKIFFWGATVQLERDYTVWNHKRYAKNPLLMKEDIQIAQHRRWYSQFYTQTSKSWKEAVSHQSGLEW